MIALPSTCLRFGPGVIAWLGLLSMAPSASAGAAAPLWFDFGTEQSAVWAGCSRVTNTTMWRPPATAGWERSAGLSAAVRVHGAPVENRSRGTMDPPPIWTNPITEDCVQGATANSFRMPVGAGEYEVYVLCGTSDSAARSQFFDFDVDVGGSVQRVQIEGPYPFRPLRFRAKASGGSLAVNFRPRSKWVVNAILAWPAGDAAQAPPQIIAALEEWTFRMPPAEWAKWKEEPAPPDGPMPPISAADAARGFVVYARHYLDCIYPSTRPRAEELNPQLRIFAARGQYVTTSFTVLPLRDLPGATVITNALGPVRGPDVEVRHARFTRARPNYTVQHRWRWVPDVLARFSTLDLQAGQNARFWITIRVPDDAPAGMHESAVRFHTATGVADVPIRLRILPFTLRDDPAKIFAIYYRHPYDLMANAPDELSREYFRRKAELEHRDLAAHGTRNVTLSISSRAADAQGNFAFNWELLAAKLELWRKHRFVGPVVMGIPTATVYEKYMRERPGSHLRGVKIPPPEFAAEITAMVKAIESERARRGWPEFLYYPVDEPSTDAVAVQFMVTVLRACKAAGVRTYVTADPTREHFAPMRPVVDVWCTQPFAPDRDTVEADMKARPVEYWCYPNHVNGENDHTPVAGARMTYGFGFWRSGFRALIPWIYQASSGDPFNYLDAATSDFFNRSEPDGTPMPVAMWEAYREGYNDYRYVFTLEQLMVEARTSGRPAAEAAARHAEAERRFVWDAIRVQAKYKHDDLWSAEEFDVHRWIIARQILALEDALRR